MAIKRPRLTAEQRAQIIEMHRYGATPKEIMTSTGLSMHNVKKAIAAADANGKSNHIDVVVAAPKKAKARKAKARKAVKVGSKVQPILEQINAKLRKMGIAEATFTVEQGLVKYTAAQTQTIQL